MWQKQSNTEALTENIGGNMNKNQLVLSWLNQAIGFSNIKIQKLLEYFGSPQEIWDNFEKEQNFLNILNSETISVLLKSKNNFEEKFSEKINRENVKIITCFDDEYPKKLRNLIGAPHILYYKGNLSGCENISIAVVGSRKATSYGKWAAEKFTKELSQLNVTIISGLAAGIDSTAHKTAIKSNAPTIGVIGCGIDIVYPKHNEHLYEEVIENKGAVITEFPFGMKPLPVNFPIRNRIISGLSDGVLVIEAQEKSGTLITASHAADQGKDIFAVPGNINSLYSKGTNALIKDGAKLVSSIDDLIEEIQQLKEYVQKNKNMSTYDLTEKEIEIINTLKSGEKNVFEISEQVNMNIGEILSILTLLEMKGAVKQLQGKNFYLA